MFTTLGTWKQTQTQAKVKQTQVFYCLALLVVLGCHLILNESPTEAGFVHLYINLLLSQWRMAFYECIYTSF